MKHGEEREMDVCILHWKKGRWKLGSLPYDERKF